MKLLNKTASDVITITKTIGSKVIKGFEYRNPELNQTNLYLIFLEKGEVWRISLSINQKDEVKIQNAKDTFDHILSTFKFTQ